MALAPARLAHAAGGGRAAAADGYGARAHEQRPGQSSCACTHMSSNALAPADEAARAVAARAEMGEGVKGVWASSDKPYPIYTMLDQLATVRS